MLVVRSLSKSVPGAAGARRTLFSGLDLDLAAGEYVAVMGESGVGKSTLLNLIAGLDTPDAGSIALDGSDLTKLDDDGRTLLRRSHVGFVFQAFHILPYLTVAWNVALPLVLLGKRDDEAHSVAREVLERVAMGDRATSMPRELSGGELQRVAIARALVHRPRLVLADEPTGNLDPETARHVLELFRRQVKERGAAAILATHSEQAAAGCDRRYRLSAEGLEPLA